MAYLTASCDATMERLRMRFVVPISALLLFLSGASTSPFIEAAAACESLCLNGKGRPLEERSANFVVWSASSSDTTGTSPRHSGLGEARSDKRIQIAVSGVPRDSSASAVILETTFGVNWVGREPVHPDWVVAVAIKESKQLGSH